MDGRYRRYPTARGIWVTVTGQPDVREPAAGGSARLHGDELRAALAPFIELKFGLTTISRCNSASAGSFLPVRTAPARKDGSELLAWVSGPPLFDDHRHFAFLSPAQDSPAPPARIVQLRQGATGFLFQLAPTARRARFHTSILAGDHEAH